ncbi:ammonia-dependent NAD(+) synthetase [Corynebacterium sp. 335C]
MDNLRDRIITDLDVRPDVDPAAEVDRRVGFLRDYLEATGAKGLVLGISGGQDSSLAGRLCQLAVEGRRAEGAEAAFIAVRLPHGVQADEDDAQLALDFIRPDERATVDIAPAVAAIAAPAAAGAHPGEDGARLTDFNKGNVKARMRMIAQYAIAGERGMLVVGTDHAAEAVTGFFTKHGDGAADLIPLAGLTKGQGARMLEHLGADSRLWRKAPTADLEEDRPGLADEDALGVTYADIDAYLEGRDVHPAAAERIEAWYLRTRHKRELPPGPSETWWRG